MDESSYIFYTLVNVTYIAREIFSFTLLHIFQYSQEPNWYVSLAVSTIELVGEKGSTKAFIMKPTWIWSHRWKCVSLKRINIEHIFGFVHADIYTWNSSFLYYSPKLVFTFFSVLHTYNYLSFHNFPSYSALVWGRR